MLLLWTTALLLTTFASGFTVVAPGSIHRSNTELYASDITLARSDGTSLEDAASFMVRSFWLESPQGLLLSEPSGKSGKLVEQQLLDFVDTYGERMGKRVLDTMLIQAFLGDEIVGLVGLQVSLLDKNEGDFLSASKSQDTLQKAVASLGPKQRRQYKDASVQEICTELLPPGEYQAVVVLSNLVVSPSSRGQGMGQKLMAEAEKITKDDWGYDELHLRVEKDNAAACSLYQKLGYTQQYLLEDAVGVRVDGDEFTDILVDTIVMVKSIYQ